MESQEVHKSLNALRTHYRTHLAASAKAALVAEANASGHQRQLRVIAVENKALLETCHELKQQQALLKSKLMLQTATQQEMSEEYEEALQTLRTNHTTELQKKRFLK
jgi:hypothetical protein